MPHAIAQVRFPPTPPTTRATDHLILFGEFSTAEHTNSNVSAPCSVLGFFFTPLHRDKESAYRRWKSGDEASCMCGRDEIVELATNYGEGITVSGARACRHCLAITHDPLPDPDTDPTMVKAGLPWWWANS